MLKPDIRLELSVLPYQYEGLSADIQKMSLQIRACRLPRLLDVMAAPAKETQEGSVV